MKDMKRNKDDCKNSKNGLDNFILIDGPIDLSTQEEYISFSETIDFDNVANWLETVLLRNDNGLHFDPGSLFNHPLAYVFLIEGKRNRDRLGRRKGKDPFLLHSTKKWKDLREITLKGNKDQEMSNTNWNWH